MTSMCDFPSSLREKYALKKSSTPTLLNTAGHSGVTRLGAGPRIAFSLPLLNVAMEILSFSALIVARCSILR